MNAFYYMPGASAPEWNPQEHIAALAWPAENAQEPEHTTQGTRDARNTMEKDKAAWMAQSDRSTDARRQQKTTSAPSFTEVYQRIQFATNTRTQTELANILEIRQSSISDAKRRNKIPSNWYMLLFEKFGLNQDWLRYATGPMYLRTEQGYTPQEPSAANIKEPAYYSDPASKSTLATVYSMHCRPHGADGMTELDAIGKLALPSNFVGPDTLVLRLHSNDMAPTMQQGAYLGVNTADARPLSGGVFVLRDEHVGLLVRRIFLDYGSKSFVLRPDNDKCPASMAPAGELADRIIGRVSWIIQEIV